ncbi:MAG: hypothetical protein GY910_24925 [bacterium]|nr:hypothetical protein [bacterium]
MLVPIAIVAAVFLALSFWLFRTLPGTSGAEGWLAGFFLLAAFSMPLWVWQTQDQPVLGDFESMLVLVSHGLMSAVMCSYTLFIGRMFRPDSS